MNWVESGETAENASGTFARVGPKWDDACCQMYFENEHGCELKQLGIN